ncbi:MAG TPA: hypothetical protein VFZ58_01990 [Candidatus Saccharimonadales bacterium]
MLNFLNTPPSPEAEPPHPPGERRSAVSRAWQWASVGGNALLGAVEIIFGHASNTLSVLADGLHNAGDAVSYGTQTDNERNGHKYSEEKLKRRRKFGYWVITLSSGLAGMKAGVDLASGQESEHNQVALYAAAASLSLSSLLLVRLQKGIRRKKQLEGRSSMTMEEKDLMMHVGRFDVPSAAAATIGALVQKHNVDVEQWIAMVSGAYGVCLFRPTEKNLAENHAHSLEELEKGHRCDHGHGHRVSSPHEHEHRLTWADKLASHIWATGSYFGGRLKQRHEAPLCEESKEYSLTKKTLLGATAVTGAALGATAWKYV